MKHNSSPKTPKGIQEFPGYQILEKIHKGSHSSVYRAEDQVHQRQVYIKQFFAEFPTSEQLARFRHEYRITAGLRTDCVIAVVDWINDDQNPSIVLEDFGGQSLSEIYADRTADIAEFLEIAIAAAAALADIHHQNIIHKDINPANIVYSLETRTLKIIDFGIASELLTETRQQVAPEHLEGTLAYISPEQTGRMNRALDRRSDLYSLGGAFYRLLVGQPPFLQEDPAALVHAHLAQQPEAPHKLRSQVPEMISQITLKLLAKNAEERYRSAAGLLYDLKCCDAELKKNGKITTFESGAKDLPERFYIPQKFYGRENEIEELLASFEKTSTGACELLFVAGEGGIGKSSLIQEVRRPLARGNGRFISGKFDQFRRDLPYAAFAAAFEELFRGILTENETNIQDWKTKLEKGLGENSGVIADMAPGLANVLGELPPVPDITPEEAQSRFYYIFLEFMQAITGPEHPLVIFLDDLQWADLASLGLLERILNDPRSRYLLLICAYRENEIHAGHPLATLLENLKKRNEVVKTIRPGPLAQNNVRELLQEALYTGPENIEQASRILTDKTQGNPFFLRQLLETLATGGGIVRDVEHACFRLDLPALEEMQVTGNVAELMSKKILKLPQSEQNVLKTASCLGDSFNASALLGLFEAEHAEIYAALAGLVRQGLLLPLNEQFLYMDDAQANDLASKARFRFLHDRVRQAADELLTPAEHSRFHFHAGRILLNSLSGNENIIDIVNHLNAGRGEITEASEFIMLATMNLAAGRRAMLSAAFDSALSYFRAGHELLPEDANQMHYRLYRDLQITMCQAMYQLGHYEELEKLTGELLPIMQNDLDRIKLYQIRILAETTRSEYRKVIRETRLALALCGVAMPEKTSMARILWELVRTRIALRGKSNQDLKQLPVTNDDFRRAAMHVMTMAVPAASIFDMNLNVWFSLKGVQISIRYGISMYSAFFFTMYSFIVSNILNKLQEGYDYSALALQLAERFSSVAARIPAILTANGSVFHWTEGLRKTTDRLLENYQKGPEAGERMATAYRIGTAYYQYMLTGRNLQELDDEFVAHFEYLSRLNQINVDSWISNWRHFILNVREPHEGGVDLGASYLRSEKALASYREVSDAIGIFTIYFSTLYLAVLFRNPEKARSLALDGEADVQSGIGTAIYAPFFLLQSLALVNDLEAPDRRIRNKARGMVKRNRKKLAFWAKHCPENMLHRSLLVEAEYLRIQKRLGDAREKYELAIANAYKHGYVNDAGLACELFAEFHIKQGNNLAAQMYVRQARYFFQLWGAHNKIVDLETRYPRWLAAPSVGTETKHTIGHTSTSQGGGLSLDLTAILQASRALSGEMEMERLLKQLVQLVLENAGARRCSLILPGKEGLYIAARGMVGEEAQTVNIPVGALLDEEKDTPLCSDAVRLTARTRTAMLLESACETGELTGNAYIQREEVHSLFCIPLVRLGALSGVLYLENRLLQGAFTVERREVLDIIAGQAAVSLENARLYDEQRRAAEAFAYFVPTEFLRMLGRNDVQDVRLGDNASKEMIVLFSDIRSFTTLSESMTPDENFRFINGYLRRIGPSIHKHGGFIDKFIGDAIMALFDTAPEQALDAALDMIRNVHDYNAEREKTGKQRIAVGVGLHYGSVILGILGEQRRMDVTAISNSVNIASRLEGLSKVFGCRVIISETVMRSIDASKRHTRYLGRVRVAGIEEPLAVYEVFDADDREVFEHKQETGERFSRAMELFQKREFQQAGEIFRELHGKNSDDNPACFFVSQCEMMARVDPADGWDGSISVSAK